MEQFNSLFLDAEMLEDDFRYILKNAFRDKEALDFFGSEIYLIPMNVDFTPKTKLPAVYIELQKTGTVPTAQEDIQVDPFSRINVVVETYTSGDDKKRKNIQLSQFVTHILQTNQAMPNYYNRGLRFEEDRRLSSIVEGVDRHRVRFSGVVDNNLKLILNKT